MKSITTTLLAMTFMTPVYAQDADSKMWYLTPGVNTPGNVSFGENAPNWSQINEGQDPEGLYTPLRFNQRDGSSREYKPDEVPSNFRSITNINRIARTFGSAPVGVCQLGEVPSSSQSAPGVRPSPLRPLPQLTSAFDVGIAGINPRDRNISGQEYCAQFIGADGNYGDLGRYIQQQIRAQSAARSLTRDDLPTMQGDNSICPNWGRMTQEEREHFWVWTMAAIAWDESKCGHPNWLVNEQNPEAVGMLQMNLSESGRNWRGRACRTSAGESIMDHQVNVRCGLHILTDLLNTPNMYQTNGRLYVRNSYWEKLRTPHGIKHGSIDEKVASYPLCRN